MWTSSTSLRKVSKLLFLLLGSLVKLETIKFTTSTLRQKRSKKNIPVMIITRSNSYVKKATRENK